MTVELHNVCAAVVFGWWLQSLLSHVTHGHEGSGAGLNVSDNSTVTFEILPGLYGVLAASGLLFLVVITLICCTMILAHGKIVPQKAKMTLHKLRQQHEDTDIPDYPDYCNTELISYHSKVTSPPTLSSTRATTTATTASSEDRHTNSMSADNGVLLVSKQTTV